MIDKRIIFEDKFVDDEYETTTLYFIAPKEMLNGKYPEAEHAEISIEMPTAHMEARYASAQLSPTKYFEEECCYTDYDWRDVNMSYEEIEELIALAERSE